jgi:hypothetical protein
MLIVCYFNIFYTPKIFDVLYFDGWQNTIKINLFSMG